MKKAPVTELTELTELRNDMFDNFISYALERGSNNLDSDVIACMIGFCSRVVHYIFCACVDNEGILYADAKSVLVAISEHLKQDIDTIMDAVLAKKEREMKNGGSGAV